MDRTSSCVCICLADTRAASASVSAANRDSEFLLHALRHVPSHWTKLGTKKYSIYRRLRTNNLDFVPVLIAVFEAAAFAGASSEMDIGDMSSEGLGAAGHGAVGRGLQVSVFLVRHVVLHQVVHGDDPAVVELPVQRHLLLLHFWLHLHHF